MLPKSHNVTLHGLGFLRARFFTGSIFLRVRCFTGAVFYGRDNQKKDKWQSRENELFRCILITYMQYGPIMNGLSTFSYTFMLSPKWLRLGEDDPYFSKLNEIMESVLDLKKNSKEYKFLDEELTKKLLALDKIEAAGQDNVRHQ